MTTMATYMINKLYEKYFNHELAINKSIIKMGKAKKLSPFA